MSLFARIIYGMKTRKRGVCVNEGNFVNEWQGFTCFRQRLGNHKLGHVDFVLQQIRYRLFDIPTTPVELNSNETRMALCGSNQLTLLPRPRLAQ
jgi:hypothetical protein